MGRFLKSTKSPQSVRHIWMFHCARWFPCQLWSLLSRLISLKWNSLFTWDITKGTRFFICLRQTGRAKSMFLYIIEHGMCIGSLKMSDLRRCYGKTQTWCTFPAKCFLWDMNHRIQAWVPYINKLYSDDPSWHIFANSILLDISKGLWSCS